MIRASATFQITGWDEKPYHQGEGKAKLTRATIAKTFQGDIEGHGTLEYLMAYTEGGPTTVVGMERIEGRLGKRSGSFVLRHLATVEGGVVNGTMIVVPGSGTGGLRGLRGSGTATLVHAERYPMTLDYEIEEGA